jgi:hypothetical protein
LVRDRHRGSRWRCGDGRESTRPGYRRWSHRGLLAR